MCVEQLLDGEGLALLQPLQGIPLHGLKEYGMNPGRNGVHEDHCPEVKGPSVTKDVHEALQDHLVDGTLGVCVCVCVYFISLT